jgi:hypothetical protein
MPAYRTKYKDEYCDKIIELSAQGMHFCEIAGQWRVAEETLNEWARSIPEFSEAKAIAKTVAKAYWLGELKDVAKTGDFQVGRAPALIFKLKACYGLRDKDPNITKISTETPKGDTVFNFETVPDSNYEPPELDGEK